MGKVAGKIRSFRHRRTWANRLTVHGRQIEGRLGAGWFDAARKAGRKCRKKRPGHGLYPGLEMACDGWVLGVYALSETHGTRRVVRVALVICAELEATFVLKGMAQRGGAVDEGDRSHHGGAVHEFDIAGGSAHGRGNGCG